MKKDEYIYPQEKNSLPWKRIGQLVLVLLSLAVLVLTIRILIRHKNQSDLFETFRLAIEEKRYGDALDAYHRVQSTATDLNRSAEDRDSHRSLQEKMEEFTGKLTDQAIAELISGGSLSDDRQRMISGLNEIAAAHITPQIRAQSEAFLDGKISRDSWHLFVSSLARIPSLSMISNGFLEQEECLAVQTDAFAEGKRKEEMNDWRSAWSFWQSLAENPEICRFARDYAQFRLKSYQESQYELLVDEVRKMMKADQFYSAQELLTQLKDVFPQRQELADLLKSLDGRVPASVEPWTGEVLVLSVRPLVVRDELAFARSGNQQFADNSQITGDEFRLLLEKLRQQDFVLISPSQYLSWPDRRPQLLLPSGKKPVMLVFDRWEYTVLDQVCGTAGKIFLDEQGVLKAEAGEKTGREYDAIPILEDFIALHPEFSFDGAKALISLNISENFLGYFYSPAQEEESRTAWARVGQEFPRLTEEEYLEQNRELGRVVNYLLERGFDLGSGGFYGADTASLSAEQLEEELDSWAEALAPYLSSCRYFIFPNGSHVYSSESSVRQLLAHGFNIFFGEGPGPYHFFTESYVHFDRIPINAATLGPNGISLRKYFDPEGIMNEQIRSEGSLE